MLPVTTNPMGTITSNPIQNSSGLSKEAAQKQAQDALYVYTGSWSNIQPGETDVIYFHRQGRESRLEFDICCNFINSDVCVLGELSFDEKQKSWTLELSSSQIEKLDIDPLMFFSLDDVMNFLCEQYKAKPYTSPLTTLSISNSTGLFITSILEDEPIGTYIFHKNIGDYDPDFNQEFFVLKYDDGKYRSYGVKKLCPNPENIGKYLKSQYISPSLKEVKEKHGLYRYHKVLDFTPLFFIPKESRERYLANVDEETKTSLEILAITGRGDIDLVNLMLRFAASCPALKRMEICHTKESRNNATSKFKALNSTNCSVQELNALKTNIEILKNSFRVDQYCQILRSFLPSLFRRLKEIPFHGFISQLGERPSANLFDKKDYADINIIVGDEKFPKNRTVLAMYAKTLKGLIDKRWADGEANEIHVEGFSYETVFKTLECVYKGRIPLTFEEAKNICALSHQWGDFEVHGFCEWVILSFFSHENGAKTPEELLGIIDRESDIYPTLSSEMKTHLLLRVGKYLPNFCEGYEDESILLDRLLGVWLEVVEEKIEFELNQREDNQRRIREYLKV